MKTEPLSPAAVQLWPTSRETESEPLPGTAMCHQVPDSEAKLYAKFWGTAVANERKSSALGTLG